MKENFYSRDLTMTRTCIANRTSRQSFHENQTDGGKARLRSVPSVRVGSTRLVPEIINKIIRFLSLAACWPFFKGIIFSFS